MKLALVQMRVAPGDVSGNLSRAAQWTATAARDGADFVLLPEALPFGWMDPACHEHAQPIPEGEHFQFFAQCARANGIHLCTGLVERAGNRVFNAAVLISPDGELLLLHRKIFELGIAHDCYALGDRLGVAETKHGRIGLMICADGFAPGQSISRTLALMGAQLILSPCAWAVPPSHDNSVETYGQLWLDNYGAVTRDHPVAIAGCSNVGPVLSGAWAGHKCIGCSLVLDADRGIIARGKYGADAEEIIYADLDLSKAIDRAQP